MRFLASFVWRWRLRQALKISDMERQPIVIMALHSALREHTPTYLKDWHSTMHEVGGAVDDLHDLMEWMREDGLYEKSDRLRVIMARLAKSIPEHKIRYDQSGKVYLLRDISRTYK